MEKNYEKLKEDFERRDSSLVSFENFYKEADIRSRMMVGKISSEAARGAKTKVLIHGGFHTRLISELLTEKKISHIVVAPKITKADYSEGARYLSVFEEGKSASRFAGKRGNVICVSEHHSRGRRGAGRPGRVDDFVGFKAPRKAPMGRAAKQKRSLKTAAKNSCWCMMNQAQGRPGFGTCL